MDAEDSGRKDPALGLYRDPPPDGRGPALSFEEKREARALAGLTWWTAKVSNLRHPD